MRTLLIRQIDQSDQPRFQVVRLSDGKCTEGSVIPSPAGIPVAGRPDSNLLSELRWYQEEFLDYPFHPETDHAERVLDALQQWGLAAFDALFGSMHGRDWFKDATRSGHEQLRLIVSSDDPRILSWPWEALRDPETDVLALGCQIERKLNQIADPLPLSNKLPRDRVNILLITARPFEGDVGYRSISRPLVYLIEIQRLPACVTLLRPPAFDQLIEHLREHPDTYHILHFDGHGGYGNPAHNSSDRHRLQGAMGQLVFETVDGQPDYIPADRLGTLLREHRIPAVVLNACQSAMVDERAADPFASVAASLLKAGVRSVVAMAYSLYVSGAQQFLPAFYRRLFEKGSVAEAVRSGRQQMFRNQGRICARGSYPLQDWLVPVTYAQEAIDFRFAANGIQGIQSLDKASLPEEAQDSQNPYGFVGRDGALMALERAMRRPAAGILIHGLAGSGKTTLARGFIRWLKQTGGLGQGCFWFTFSEIRSVEYLFNSMGETLFGNSFNAASLKQKVNTLTQRLYEQQFLIVWDNFESAQGIKGTSVAGLLSSDDQQLLKQFLEKLRGGKTKILITSRSDEEWLGPTNRYKLLLGGLYGEERWEFCSVILNDLGKTINRDDPELIKLMNALDGHPLMMRVILPQLEDKTATALLAALQKNLGALGLTGDEAWEKLQATLRFATQGLPVELQPLLVILALHEQYIVLLERIAQRVDDGWTRQQLELFLEIMATAGLVRKVGRKVYEIHPALTGYLREYARPEADIRDTWARAFVDVMGTLADSLTPRPLQDQQGLFQVCEGSFHAALTEAERLGMDQSIGALTQVLASHALNRRSFTVARELLLQMAEHDRKCGEDKNVAAAYHQLGIIAIEQLDIPAAKSWYEKSLTISERLGDNYDIAKTYHQLGMIAMQQREFPAAEIWCKKSLAIKEKLGDDLGAASTYHQLGMIAEEQNDFPAAEGWYNKSLAISERLGYDLNAGATYHQLGMIAQKQKDFPAAEGWYNKSLAIREKLGDEYGTAMTYHQLGMNAQEQKDFPAAERWYKKSMTIDEMLGNEHHAASTYGQLGVLAGIQSRFEDAGKWFIKSCAIFARQNDPVTMQKGERNFLICFLKATPAEQQILRTMWEEAGLGPFPQQ